MQLSAPRRSRSALSSQFGIGASRLRHEARTVEMRRRDDVERRQGPDGGTFSCVRLSRMRRVLVVFVLVATVAGALGGASATAARGPVNGRWEGTSKHGVTLRFAVSRFRGRPVMVSPTLTCPEVPADYPGQLASEDFENAAPGERELAGPIDADGHVYFDEQAGLQPPTAPTFSGLLHETQGTINGRGSRGGACNFTRMRVARVSAATYGNGVWTGVGSFLTTISAMVYSGGGLIEFVGSSEIPATNWVGEPLNPDYSEDPLACLVAYSPTSVPVSAAGTISAGGVFPDPLEPGTLVVTGAFASSTAIAGAYAGGWGSTVGEDVCSMNGVWAANLTVPYKGLRWPSGYRPPPRHPTRCMRVSQIAKVSISATKYPAIVKHIHDAIAAGWPRVLVLNRPAAEARRRKLLQRFPPRAGYDRDEYPPAILRGRGAGQRGQNPRGWQASVAYVPQDQNRGAGAVQGAKLRRYCNGQRIALIGF